MSTATVSTPRLTRLVDGLVSTLRAFIREQHLTHDEYRQAVAFLVKTAEQGEIPLLLATPEAPTRRKTSPSTPRPIRVPLTVRLDLRKGEE